MPFLIAAIFRGSFDDTTSALMGAADRSGRHGRSLLPGHHGSHPHGRQQCTQNPKSSGLATIS
jgi:hypothetical protein